MDGKSLTPQEIKLQKLKEILLEAFQEVRSLFNGQQFFSTPKPIRLINQTIEIGSNKNDLILDFFSGSGTTAHAVMQLNAEDGGNRKCISVNEKIK